MLFGGGVLVIGALTLGAYLMQKSLRRELKPEETEPAKMRVKDEATFALTAVKGVITQLKTEQKAAQEKLVAAERLAEENTRKFELLAREIDYGLMTFNAEGFITFSNPLVRKLLVVDTWSRRRFGEILQDNPALSKLIAECFENGTETRKNIIKVQGFDAIRRQVKVSVLQTRDHSGALEVVACMFREMPPPTPGD
jgi:hypothetical protein